MVKDRKILPQVMDQLWENQVIVHLHIANNSDLLNCISYDCNDKTLRAQFKNSSDYVYLYKNVSIVEWTQVVASESIGSALIKYIINCKECKKFNAITMQYEKCKQPKNIK